jgi:hypothetical protein
MNYFSGKPNVAAWTSGTASIDTARADAASFFTQERLRDDIRLWVKRFINLINGRDGCHAR